ncbi:HAMP domain-containing sensor histidine kinase [Actinomycetota bacterium Odt1-20B]
MKRRRGPRTLRTRLVIAAVGLIAVICAVIGTVTTIALHTYLYAQLDKQVHEVVGMADGGHLLPGPGSNEPLRFLAGPGNKNTVGAVLDTADGTVREAARSDRDSTTRTSDLTEAQATALASVPRDGTEHSVHLPGLGDYRVGAKPGGTIVVGLPETEVRGTLSTLIWVEVSVTAAGLVAASLAGAAMVGVALRPLRRVAATATRVSELPLHSGEVTLHERVPESEADPHTEVGQVGAALNRMLDHVHGALHARQSSETRVRQFVADASHELRTPLASIRGYAELTRRGHERGHEEAGPDTRHALGRIESEAHRMTGLVEDLLLLARIDAGRPLSYADTDLSPLVVDAVSDARAAGPGHTWRLDVPADPVPVRADAARLHQVLVNLLANARTHTPPGTTVTARVHIEGPWARLDVEDDGPGIPAELRPHVFERFARGDTSRSRAHGSTGLGLAIVRAVTDAHGGTVTVESAPGRTVFTVRLPLLTVRLPLNPSPAPSSQPPLNPSLNPPPAPYSQPHHSLTTQL